MPEIQGLDGSVLLNAMRAGRQDRFNDDMQRMKVQQGQIAMQRQQAVTNLLTQAGGSSGGGVMGNAMGAPTAPTTPTGTASPGYAPTNVSPATVGQASPMGGGMNPALIGQVSALDPETGDKMAQAFKSVSDTQLKQYQSMNDALGAVAHWLASKPLADRAALFDHAVPDLLRAGWTQAQIDGARNDLSDQVLQYHQMKATSYDKMIDNELKQREFMAGKVTPVAPGGAAYVTKPVIGQDGSVSTTSEPVILPNPGGAIPGAPTAPKTPQIIAQRPAGKTDEQLLHDAHEAVRRGANAETVFRQLQAWGVNP